MTDTAREPVVMIKEFALGTLTKMRPFLYYPHLEKATTSPGRGRLKIFDNELLLHIEIHNGIQPLFKMSTAAFGSFWGFFQYKNPI